MKLPSFKRKKQRGKSKSAEQKFKEKRAKVDSYLLDVWLRQLKSDPTLAQRISEQKYGSETVMAYGQDGEYREEPDLLSVLRQAKEARNLLKDELGESKGSWMKDIAEVMRNLPAVLQSMGQMNPGQLQQFSQPTAISQPRPQQIPKPIQDPPESSQPESNEVSLETIMSLLEFEPAAAWDKLNPAWQNYLRHTSYEELEQNLKAIGEATPEAQPHIDSFLKQKHHWLQELVTIAHQR